MTELPLRIWPGVAIVAVQWLATFGSGQVAPGTVVQLFGMMGGPLGGVLLLIVWWLSASRAPRALRFGGVGLLLAGLVAAAAAADRSMPMAMVVYAIPVVCLGFVVWAVLTRRLTARARWLALAVTLVVTCGVWPLLRADGVLGDLTMELSWRWAPTAEDRLLATAADPTAPPPPQAEVESAVAMPAPWPGFRGRDRNGVVSGVELATDWTATPPELLWRRGVGPGWSSFALAGGRLFTQEQRGEDEVVSAYDAATGEPLWLHGDKARFWEAMAGAGPRATPTYDAGWLYTVGAYGRLNALDPATGQVRWTRAVSVDTEAKPPDWGYASSPLVVDGLVVVQTGAKAGNTVVAYDRGTGEPRWQTDAGGHSYSSAHLTELAGVRQLLILTGAGVASVAPADGALLWQHDWPMPGDDSRIVQPGLLRDGAGILIGTGFGMGKGLLYQHLDRFIIHHITVGINQAVLTMRGKWV